VSQEPTTADDRLPEAPAYRMALGAVVLCALMLAGWEAVWRAQGIRPSVTDDRSLWSYHRAHVDAAGPDTVVLLGMSRILQAFHGDVFREAAPGLEYIQLAVAAKHPVAALQDLAFESRFDGIVLCSILTAGLLPELHGQQGEHVAYYHQQFDPIEHAGRGIGNALQSRLAFMAPDALPQRAGPELLRGDLEPQFLVQLPDRTQRVDYHRVDLEQFREDRLATIRRNIEDYVRQPGYENWPSGYAPVEAAVKAIQDRGGTVVFLRMPTSGAYHRAIEARFPRERFWDVLAQRTAATTIHFQDVPEWAELECAEGSHLHLEDAAEFTRTLALKLQDIARARHARAQEIDS